MKFQKYSILALTLSQSVRDSLYVKTFCSFFGFVIYPLNMSRIISVNRNTLWNKVYLISVPCIYDIINISLTTPALEHVFNQDVKSFPKEKYIIINLVGTFVWSGQTVVSMYFIFWGIIPNYTVSLSRFIPPKGCSCGQTNTFAYSTQCSGRRGVCAMVHKGKFTW